MTWTIAMLQLPPAGTGTGPFAALSLIVAPAILTNAASLLVMSTSNRLARAVDLTRELARELEGTSAAGNPESGRRLRELAGAEARSLLLVRALRAVYLAMAGFGSATFVSLIGVVLVRGPGTATDRAIELLALLAGIVGIGGILWAAMLLVRETRIAVATLAERVEAQQRRFGARG